MTGVVPTPDRDDGPERRSYFEYATRLLIAYKWPIVFGVVIVSILLWDAISSGKVLPTWDTTPRWLKLLIVGGVGSVIVGYLPADWMYKKHFSPECERLNEVDALRDINRTHDVPQEVWDEKREVVDGELHINNDGEYVCRRVEWTGEKLKLWCNWRGEATDTELMTFENALEETQGRQRFWMQVGKTLKAKMPFYLRSLEQSITEKVARKTIEKSTDTLDLYEDEVVENAEITVDSIDVPDGYYSDELEEEVDQMLNEDTGGALDKLEGGDHE